MNSGGDGRPKGVRIPPGERVEPLDLLGQQLRAMYDDVAAAEPPAEILALIDQLDSLQVVAPREPRTIPPDEP